MYNNSNRDDYSYGSFGYGRSNYGSPDYNRSYHHNDNDWMDKAANKVNQWFDSDNDRYNQGRNEYREHNYRNRYEPVYNNSDRNYGRSEYHNYERNDFGDNNRNAYIFREDSGYYQSPSDHFENNGRNEASMGRSTYGIPGTDRFGQTWYNENPGRNSYRTEDHDRGLADRAKDEVKSWFGNDEAARRREHDNRTNLGNAWHGDRDSYHSRDHYRGNERDSDWVINHNRSYISPDYDNRW